MRPSKDPQTALGVVLKELRREQEITQRAIADKADLTYAHYCAIEGGQTNPLWGTMRRIAQAFGVTVTEIAKREEGQSVDGRAQRDARGGRRKD
jgi:transcriptional regulator with XRE-family HTH domain